MMNRRTLSYVFLGYVVVAWGLMLAIDPRTRGGGIALWFCITLGYCAVAALVYWLAGLTRSINAMGKAAEQQIKK